MVKMRDANYCNLKLLLIFFVVYGHWIENMIQESEILLMQYKVIYMFHMPLFIFLSGLFLNCNKDCKRQVKKILPMYLLGQTIAIVSGAAQADTPWWTLWYLLSYCIWAGIGRLVIQFKSARAKYMILGISIIVGALAGYIPSLGRAWSGSRTIVFFPYFWAGFICKPDFQWKNYRILGIGALIVAIFIIGFWGDKIPVWFLYHAESYGTIQNGFGLRLLCYTIGGLLGFFLLTNISGRRYPFTKMGADTMPVYLLHAPMIACLGEMKFPWGVYVCLSAAFIYIIYKISLWNSALFGVIPERRDRSDWISRNIRKIQQGSVSFPSVSDKK